MVVGLHGAAVLSEDQKSLREILLYGIKGMAAYAHHAYRVGQSDAEVTGFLYKGMASLANIHLTVEELLPLVLECGKANLKCLEILDRGHTTHFGDPEPTAVKIGHRKGAAIIVSGHELFDLETLLEQTKRQRSQYLYPWGDASGLGLSAFKEICSFGGAFWDCLAKSASGI